MTTYSVKRVQVKDYERALQVISEARRAIASLGIDQWQDGNPTPENIYSDIQAGNLYGAYDHQEKLMAVAAIITGTEPVYAKIDGKWLTDDAYVTVHRMGASDEARGKGAAGVIMDKAFEIAQNTGAASVRIDTHLGNVAMRRFLAKRDFVPCGLVDYSFQTTGDPIRIAYEKCLEERNQ